MKLEIAGLNAFYGRAHILFDVGFQVGAGEVVALLGRNGAGKSTTFKSIVGQVSHRASLLRFDGHDIARAPGHEIAKLGLGYVPEDRRVFTELTVEENFLVGRQKPRAGAPEWTPEKIYALFPNLGRMKTRPGGRMSGGEQQMLTIGRMLMGNPALALLDEPSEGLAPKIVEEMAAAILAMKREGLAIVLSEQNLHFARLVSDRCVILEKGRVHFEGSFADLDARPDIRDACLAV
ncbi:ABC transporter ATP-binding protein [Thioclava sp. BHET1]|nr:ABC transporter ATP-binding protein [Thioclava sp. BHET1]